MNFMISASSIILVVLLYFLPAIFAYFRKHKNFDPIFLTNFFLGWTGIGWVITLIWAFTSHIEENKPKEEARMKCPDCRELILVGARKCKHCGASITIE